MSTPKQIAANQQNSLASTGPRTVEGKRRAKRNALRHGLLAREPLVPGERVEEWRELVEGMRQSLAPVGTFEHGLVQRVALCVWRLQRLARYETTETLLGMEEVAEKLRTGANDDGEETRRLQEMGADLGQLECQGQELEEVRQFLQDLPGLRPTQALRGALALKVLKRLAEEVPFADRPIVAGFDFLAVVGVPRDLLHMPEAWTGWTAAAVVIGWQRLAAAGNLPVERLAELALARLQAEQARRVETIAGLHKQIVKTRRQLKRRQRRQLRRRLLPPAPTLDLIVRYEAHLNRQLLLALETLKRLQTLRPVPPVVLAAPAADGVPVERAEKGDAQALRPEGPLRSAQGEALGLKDPQSLPTL